MGFLSKITQMFSGDGTTSNVRMFDPVEHNGFIIIPTPQPDQGQYRVCATITKGEFEDQKVHKFIRSDLVASLDECVELTTRKAKLTIDQLGDQIF
ncbi:MAG: transcriptional regulator [Marinomonas atlantica]|nr:transcriptional regulator [Marinomonas atlantica]